MLHQRAPAQGLDRLQGGPATGLWAECGDQLGDFQRLAFDGKYAQHRVLELGTALELLGEQTPDTGEHVTRPGRLQERTNIAAEHLTDAFADHFQRQAIPTAPSNKIGPVLRIARELLLGQQSLRLGQPQAVQP